VDTLAWTVHPEIQNISRVFSETVCVRNRGIVQVGMWHCTFVNSFFFARNAFVNSLLYKHMLCACVLQFTCSTSAAVACGHVTSPGKNARCISVEMGAIEQSN
jgi:hypothetical protein